EGEPGGGGEGGGAVAAELGGAGHLAADGGDLVERVAKLVHGPSFTLYRKASAASSGSTGCDCFRERWQAYTGEDEEVAQRGAYRGGVCRLWHAELLLPLPRRPGERVLGHGPAAGDDRVHRGPGWAGDLFRAAVAGAALSTAARGMEEAAAAVPGSDAAAGGLQHHPDPVEPHGARPHARADLVQLRRPVVPLPHGVFLPDHSLRDDDRRDPAGGPVPREPPTRAGGGAAAAGSGAGGAAEPASATAAAFPLQCAQHHLGGDV